MNSLFKTLHEVVEMGKERDAGSVYSTDDQTNLASSSDPLVLRRHIATLTEQLARQVGIYGELRAESATIEKELTRLRLRFAASRELWSAANEDLETVIQNLVEHHLYGAPDITKLYSVSGGNNNVDATGASGSRSNGVDATYIASLQEQIQRLKEMVQRSGEERAQMRSEKQCEQTQRLMKSSGFDKTTVDGEVRQAVEKLIAHWQDERAQYEATIETLEKQVAAHAEREALLSDCIKQEQERNRSATAAAADQSAAMEELRTLRAELDKWRHGAQRADPTSASLVEHTSSGALLSVSELHHLEGNDHVAAARRSTETSAATSTGADQADFSGPLGTTPAAASSSGRNSVVVGSSPVPLRHAGDTSVTDVPAELTEMRPSREQQQAELEVLRHDISAREDALDSLYVDNRYLQEALQRAEAQARQYNAEVQQTQEKLEEMQRLLMREQQKSKRYEEERQKAAASENKLRDQVLELRYALSAAAAAATSNVNAALPASVGGSIDLSIPSSRGQRVGHSSRYVTVEPELSYEHGGTWKDWAVEVGRWWRELNGDTVRVRVPLTQEKSASGFPGLTGRQGATARRGPRVLLLFGGIMGVAATALLFVVLSESMYAAFKNPE